MGLDDNISANKITVIVRNIGDKTYTLEFTNNDFSPYATPNKWGITPLALSIAGNEGLYLKTYKCPAGVNTVGFGQTKEAKGKEIASEVDIPTAFKNLHNDIVTHRDLLADTFKNNFANLIPDTQGALTSLNFNAGTFGTDLSAALNSGDGEGLKYQIARYDMYKNPHTQQYEVLKGLSIRRSGEAAIIDGDYKTVWDRTVNYYGLVDMLSRSGAKPEQIGEMLDGVAKVEVRKKGKLVYQNANIDKTQAITPISPQEKVMVADNFAVPEITPKSDQPEVSKKEEAKSHATREAFLETKKPIEPHILEKAKAVIHKGASEHKHLQPPSNEGKHLQPFFQAEKHLQPFLPRNKDETKTKLSLQEPNGQPNPGSILSKPIQPPQRLV